MSNSNTQSLINLMMTFNLSTLSAINDTLMTANISPEQHDILACQHVCPVNECLRLDLTLECVEAYIFPNPMEWVFICLHLVLFTIGVVGNFLVCFVVVRSKHMQTVTNLFIMNLAVADAVVLVLCSPPTVLQSVTETWFLGDAMCKVVIFFQNTVVGVSVLTLSAIAVERYFAICRPLKSRITMRKVKFTVLVIWLISAALGSPNITNTVSAYFEQPELNVYLRTCKIGLDQKMEEIYHMFIVIAFYLVPMVIIAIFYLIISHHLWHVRVPGTMIRECETGNGYETHADVQLDSRKKVAKMLIAIVVLFAACYFPINLIFVLRQLDCLAALNDSFFLPIMFMFAHLLLYFNSAVNPLIYNFMSVKFKKEFRNVFSCRTRQNTPLHRDSTWLYSSRLTRHPTSATSGSHRSTQMSRIQDVTYPVYREVKSIHVRDDDNLRCRDLI
ncbi:hypothetical protein BsWGS_20795 [Bradybaena similaris]